MAFTPASWLATLLLAAVLLPGVTSAWAHSSGEESRDVLGPSNAAALPAEGSPASVLPIAATPELPPPLERAQVVSLYGYPGIPAMGDLGRYDPDEAAAEARRLAAIYDALNGDRGAVGALHLIVAVAQPIPMDGDSYLHRLDDATIAEYVGAARRNEVLLILDTQLGTIEPVAEARRLEPFLAEPFVHLALDPEFAMRARGGVPGEVIGSVDSSEVNAVQAYLAALVRAGGLPPKLLILHQFRDDMLTHSAPWEDAPEVLRTVNVDGWGDLATKLDTYAAFGLARYAEHAGIKLFEGWDDPMLTPEQVLALPRQPDLVVYQ